MRSARKITRMFVLPETAIHPDALVFDEFPSRDACSRAELRSLCARAMQRKGGKLSPRIRPAEMRSEPVRGTRKERRVPSPPLEPKEVSGRPQPPTPKKEVSTIRDDFKKVRNLPLL